MFQTAKIILIILIICLILGLIIRYFIPKNYYGGLIWQATETDQSEFEQNQLLQYETAKCTGGKINVLRLASNPLGFESTSSGSVQPLTEHNDTTFRYMLTHTSKDAVGIPFNSKTTLKPPSIT